MSGHVSTHWVGCGLATCASAAGDHAGARTNLRFLSGTHWRAPPDRSLAPLRPDGCIRGSGGRHDAWNVPVGASMRGHQPDTSGIDQEIGPPFALASVHEDRSD